MARYEDEYEYERRMASKMTGVTIRIQGRGISRSYRESSTTLGFALSTVKSQWKFDARRQGTNKSPVKITMTVVPPKSRLYTVNGRVTAAGKAHIAGAPNMGVAQIVGDFLLSL